MLNIRMYKSALRNLWRNKWLTVATVTVMTLTLFTVSIFVIINLLVHSTIDTIKSRIDLEVYFKQNATEDQITAIKNDLKVDPAIKSITYVSKKDALEVFKKQNINDQAIIDSITEQDNPLPASLKINLYQAERLESINDKFKKGRYSDLVDSTSFDNNKMIIDRLINVSNYVKKGGVGLSLVLILSTLVVVLNTIRINIFTRRDEIEIQKLVGATNWYIRWPFILEGAFYGLISVVISLIVIFTGMRLIAPYVGFYLGEFSVSFYEYLGQYSLGIIAAQFVLSILLGVVSSLMAMGRYLKV